MKVSGRVNKDWRMGMKEDEIDWRMGMREDEIDCLVDPMEGQ